MDLDSTLASLARDPAAPADLAELALHLARDEYPDLDVEAYLSELNGMAHEAQALMRGNLEARVFGLCRYLFHEMGFRGNIQEYYDPRNSYFNQVLDRRTGIPISLSAVVMCLGARAGLEVAGIGLPGHFITKAVADGQEILFDPFHGGRQITPGECEQLVQRVAGTVFEASAENLRALPLGWIVTRMLNNLKNVYLHEGDFPRAVRVIGRLRQLNPEDLVQQRDLGLSLMQTGQPGQAIDHLAAYVHALPGADDIMKVGQMLDRARGQVARWN